jgi:chaperonin cofactor prefoldin
MEAQQRLQTISGEYPKLQAQLQDTVDARGRLGAQLNENEAVQAVRPPF